MSLPRAAERRAEPASVSILRSKPLPTTSPDPELLGAECGVAKCELPETGWLNDGLGSTSAPAQGTSQGKKPEAAFKKLARLLNARERSLADARTRLEQSGYSQTVISAALARASACGLLDDQRFAENYIRRKLLAGWGSARIEQGLKSHGIRADCLPGYPDDYFDEQQQLAAALAALRKQRSNAKNQYKAKYRHLCQKGYPLDIVKAALQISEQPD